MSKGCLITRVKSDDRQTMNDALGQLFTDAVRDEGINAAARRRLYYTWRCFEKPREIIHAAVLKVYERKYNLKTDDCPDTCGSVGNCSGQRLLNYTKVVVQRTKCDGQDNESLGDDPPDTLGSGGQANRLDQRTWAEQVGKYFSFRFSPRMADQVYELWHLKYVEGWSYSDVYSNRPQIIEMISTRLGRPIQNADALNYWMNSVNNDMRSKLGPGPYTDE